MSTPWNKILGLKIEQIDSIRNTAYSYLMQGQLEIARKFFEGLVVILPESAYDLRILGAIYLQQNKHLVALDYIERSLKLDPLHPTALLNRAKALLGLGLRRQAKMQLENLLRVSPKDLAPRINAVLDSMS